MLPIQTRLKEGGFLLLDGAMGTMLQAANAPMGKVPEALNITHPEVIASIHKSYLEAGAQVLYANTFAANPYKVKDCPYSSTQLIQAGVKLAKDAAGGRAWVALDLGPIGEMLAPNGSLSFDTAYGYYKQMVTDGVAAGADLVVLETMTDLLELKAALLAVKENSSLPVFCTMTFEENGRTFAGVSVDCAAVTLEGLGADAIGINCSLGPAEILPLIQEMAKYTSLPLIVKANAGLPDLNTGDYNVSAEDFAKGAEEFIRCGVTILGGCCGTTPDYIRKLRTLLDQSQPVTRQVERASRLCSASRMVEVNRVRMIGERINPTGKKKFQQALREHNIGYLLTQGLEQVQAGAEILDVNVGLPDIDETSTMVEVVSQLQSVLDLPLQLDSSHPEVIEAGLRIYNGKPIVNSVNGEPEVLERILPLVKKYGAAVVGLTMDKNGIPSTAEERLDIGRRIVTACESYGIPKEDIYLDCLTLTVSVQQKEALETLKAVRLVKQELGVKTVLGVSNISFGLPDREVINTTFLTLAMEAGLDLPILNPNNAAMVGAVDAFHLLTGKDVGGEAYLARHAGQKAAAPQAPAAASSDPKEGLYQAVLAGLKEQAGSLCKELLATLPPMEVVNQVLIPALDQVGTEFETGKLFLPQLIQSATAAQASFEQIKNYLAAHPDPEAKVQKEKIILATVEGDVHDIGKNIVKVILENYGYPVIDLGKDVPVQKVVEAVRQHGAKLLGLSALMTTTVANMEKTIQAVRQAGLPCTIMVGGAVLTPEYAEKIGADYYAKDAKQSADIAKLVLG